MEQCLVHQQDYPCWKCDPSYVGLKARAELADRYEKALREIDLPIPVMSRDNYQEALITVKNIAKAALQGTGKK